MPMQTFQFQGDTTYSLASTAAINRKSCDHCFLNRKTCDKVRGPAGETGDKCKRCAKDSRPCTFTPTVHLYHIADCVGRHQCRAKVIQAMPGGRKKEIKFKTIEIPIVCDMDSELDVALFEYIHKQPNLLAYNSRIKSFLAQDMLGLTEEQEDQMSVQKNDSSDESSTATAATTTVTTALTTNGSPTHGSKRTFEMDDGKSKDSTMVDKSAISPTQGPQKFRIMALIDAHQNQSLQQQQQPQLQQQHQTQQQKSNSHGSSTHKRNLSRDRGRQQSGQGHIETAMDMPLSSNSLSPIDALSYQHRRQSETLTSPTASLTPAVPTLNQMGGLYSNQSLHPYQQPQLQIQTGHRSTSPLLQPSPGHSPTHNSPPSPLQLSFGIDTNFGSLSNTSHQNLPSLFQETLNVSSTQQSSHTSVGTSTSPTMGSLDVNNNMMLDGQQPQPQQPPPLVITTTNEDGNEVGFYYAVPPVTLRNPEYSDADIFKDFIMDADVLGEDFVWIAEDLFEDPTAEEAEATLNAMSVAAAAGTPNTPPSAPNGFMMDNSMSGITPEMPMLHGNNIPLPINSLVNPATNDVTMDGMMMSPSEQQQQQQHQQQQQRWMHQDYSQTMQG